MRAIGRSNREFVDDPAVREQIKASWSWGSVMRQLLPLLLALLCLTTSSAQEGGGKPRVPTVVAPGSGPHAYFNALAALPEKFKCYSLRPQAGVTLGATDGTNCHYEHQLKRVQPTNGGYQVAAASVAAADYSHIYHPYAGIADPDANPQDAMRTRQQPFYVLGHRNVRSLGAEIDADDTQLQILQAPGMGTSSFMNTTGRQFLIDNEVVTALPQCNRKNGPNCAFVAGSGGSGVLTVTRGSFGTAATSHSAGALVRGATNTVQSNLMLPLCDTPNRNSDNCVAGTNPQDGNTYLMTWDSRVGDSYMHQPTDPDGGLKWYNFWSGNRLANTAIWAEPRLELGGKNAGVPIRSGTAPCFDPDVHVAATGTIRSYNTVGGEPTWADSNGNETGPGTQSVSPLGPRLTAFCLKPNEWMRWWVRFDLRANDYDRISVWVASENQNPVQMIDDLLISVRPSGISKWVIQHGTSADVLIRSPYNKDLVSWTRNFVALVSAGQASAGAFSDANMKSAYLVKPLPGPAN